MRRAISFLGIIIISLEFLALPALAVAATASSGCTTGATPYCTCPAGACTTAPVAACCANTPGNSGYDPPTGVVCLCSPLVCQDIPCVIEKIINFIFVIAVALTPLMVVLGAFYLLTAGGDAARVKTGQQIIIWASVGLLVVFLAKGLVAMIRSALGPI